MSVICVIWYKIFAVFQNYWGGGTQTRKNRLKNHKRRQFFLEMSTLNQGIAIWQLFIQCFLV
jgi:hypothetical protein